MADPQSASHAAGFYWIRVDGQAREIAFWDREVQGWVLTGSEEVIDDEHSATVTVLAGPLQMPVG